MRREPQKLSTDFYLSLRRRWQLHTDFYQVVNDLSGTTGMAIIHDEQCYHELLVKNFQKKAQVSGFELIAQPSTEVIS